MIDKHLKSDIIACINDKARTDEVQDILNELAMENIENIDEGDIYFYQTAVMLFELNPNEIDTNLIGNFIFIIISHRNDLIELYGHNEKYKLYVMQLIFVLKDPKLKLSILNKVFIPGTPINKFFNVQRHFTKPDNNHGCLARLHAEIPRTILACYPEQYFNNLRRQKNSSFASFAFKHAAFYSAKNVGIGMGIVTSEVTAIGLYFFCHTHLVYHSDEPGHLLSDLPLLALIPGVLTAFAAGLVGLITSPIKAAVTLATRKPEFHLNYLDDQLAKFFINFFGVENQTIQSGKSEELTALFDKIIYHYLLEHTSATSKSSDMLINDLRNKNIELTEKLFHLIDYMTTQSKTRLEEKSKSVPITWGFRTNNGKRLFNVITKYIREYNHVEPENRRILDVESIPLRI